MERPLPVKYVLYTHYSYNDASDFSEWSKRKPCAELEGIRFFSEHLNGLRELLTSPAYEGILVIFYAPGFAECLDGIAQGKKRDQLLEIEPIKFAAELGRYIGNSLLPLYGLARRVRFVTPIDLYDIFGRMNWSIAKDLRWWFIGNSRSIRYDTPKIVEAIVRLRLLGTGVPVFRLDYDVIFRGEENENLADLGLFKTIASCIKAYRLRMDEASVATFLLSASYDTRELKMHNIKPTLDSWRGAFATRIFPSLPVIAKDISKAKKARNKKDMAWEEYAKNVFDDTLARKYYGLDRDCLRTHGVAGIGKVGAHPIASIISGAMLCLSEGAILDLPPFSNFTFNVSWIDDHLKYCLHRELRHLTTVELSIEPLLSDAKLDSVMVQKKRATIKNLPAYVLQDYLPTLLWGTVVDAWITADPLLKFRPEDLSETEKDAWFKIKRKGQSEAVLASALQKALEKGSFIKADEIPLRAALVKVALARISEVRKEWANLSNHNKQTFASIWAKGTVSSYFPEIAKKNWGIAASGIPVDTELTERAHLNPFLIEDFNTLVEDAVQYINWTINWPQIVQVVRSVEQGTLRTDLSWKP